MEGVGGLHGWQWIVSLPPLATHIFCQRHFHSVLSRRLEYVIFTLIVRLSSLTQDFSDDYRSHGVLLLYARCLSIFSPISVAPK